MVADILSLVAVLSLVAPDRPDGSAVISMVLPSPYLVDTFVATADSVAVLLLAPGQGFSVATLAVLSLVPVQSLAVFCSSVACGSIGVLAVEALAVVSETLAHTFQMVEPFPLELLVHRQRF